MSDSSNNPSWWSTVPGILTAVAAVIAAVGGLLAVVAQNGYLTGVRAPATSSQPAASAPAVTSPELAARPSRSPSAAIDRPTAEGFKGILVTSTDGSVISLPPDSEMDGSALPLNNGQKIRFDVLAAVDVEQPFDGSVRLTFVNGRQLDAKTGNYSLSGKNDLGPYRGFLSGIRRIEFVR
jgi:hypothetical protein